ncbi:MAG TPA: potassium channel protein [Cyanobacteria bacterium UBA8803]|nr:potassium channel protein [Cyanobacteria bacterium UBA8803]
MKEKLKKRIFQIIEFNNDKDCLDRICNGVIVTLIFLNLIVLCLETVDSIGAKYQILFERFDCFSLGIFTIEYILGIWSCTVDKRFRHPIGGRVRYMLTPLALLDFIAIAPSYLPILFPELRAFRSIRLLRLLRILKLTRYSDALRSMLKVFVAKSEEIIIAFFMLFILLFIASSLIYFAEHEVQAEAFPDIPSSMWWGVTTLTTVGYGDVYPVAPLGKLVGALVAILGIGIFALPAGILASGFSEEIRAKQTRRRPKLVVVCPHCGKPLNEFPAHRSKQ